MPAQDIAAALARLLQGDASFLLTNKPQRKFQHMGDESWEKESRPPRKKKARKKNGRTPTKFTPPEDGMQRFRIEVGHNHQVKPGNIVGAIANEADIDSQYIGRINIYDDYSLVDLPEGMPKEILYLLKRVWVSGQQLDISPFKKEIRAGKAGDRSKNKSKLKGRKKDKTTKKRTRKKKSIKKKA